MALVLEVNPEMADRNTFSREGHSIAITPPIDPDYWMFRVRLSTTQAIVGFPKFFTIGIGFAHEEDWNTNLPYTSDAETIFEHIKHNKQFSAISDQDCIAAIRMIQEAATIMRKKNA